MNETPPNLAHTFSIGLVLTKKKLKIGPPATLSPHFGPPWASKRPFSGIFSEIFFFQKHKLKFIVLLVEYL